VQRTYLFVPPEEKLEVQALGAHWDADSKRWYIDPDQTATNYARWLPETKDLDGHDEEEFTIVSSQAYVAATTTSCQRCNSNIEVICIYCESGTASGEPLTRFTVSHIWALDEKLEQDLRPWPNFRKAGERGDEVFASHCPHCGAVQDDLYLHSEPGDPFFDVAGALSGSIRLTPLARTIRLSGDEHFQVD
jgi:Domain of unknown function (DUF5710)